jgi:initiation factor 1A
MVKNITGGNKSKGMARKNANSGKEKATRISEDEFEMYAIVEKYHGNKMCDVLCIDGESRLCHIRGKFSGKGKRDNTVSKNTWVLVGVREYETVKEGKKANCDLLEVYNDKEKETLKSTIKAQWSLFTKMEMSDSINEDVQEETFFQFMDKTTEDHLNLMKASLELNKDTSIAVSEEEEIIDVNDL